MDRSNQAGERDDAHFHADDAFGGGVHVKADSLDPDALLAGLKAGRFYSSQGPQLHAIDLEGTELTIECSPVNAVTINGTRIRDLDAGECFGEMEYLSDTGRTATVVANRDATGTSRRRRPGGRTRP